MTNRHMDVAAPAAATLRRVLNDATQITQRPMRDFTVLSACRDPYRLDTPAGHKKGQWLADALKEVNPEGRRLHPRGLHYRLVGRVLLPDGSPYVNDDKTWQWMSEQALKAARFLGYVSWDALRDARNAPPQVFRPDYRPARWTLATGEVDVWLPENLEPRLELTGDLYRQPWQQIIIAEKQGVSDVLLPLAERYQATLALPGGELSDQMLHDMLKEANADGRPVAIHQLGDFDPAGNQMAVSTARTAQALRDSEFPDLVIRVHAVALSLEHCQAWRLPSTPLKETERRASRWKAAMGWEQTELDAAVALAARELTDVVKSSLEQYFDAGLAMRARQLKGELEAAANIRLADQLDQETLAEIRCRAELKLGELNALVEQVNASLRFDPDEAGIRLPDDPPALIGGTDVQAEPLYDSQADWSAATLRLIERKRYGEDDMEEAA